LAGFVKKMWIQIRLRFIERGSTSVCLLEHNSMQWDTRGGRIVTTRMS